MATDFILCNEDLFSKSEYDLVRNHFIQHRPGIAHFNSDALSRRPCERIENMTCLHCAREPINKSRLGRVSAIRQEKLRKRQRRALEEESVT